MSREVARPSLTLTAISVYSERLYRRRRVDAGCKKELAPLDLKKLRFRMFQTQALDPVKLSANSAVKIFFNKGRIF